jgi:hypothetical protein
MDFNAVQDFNNEPDHPAHDCFQHKLPPDIILADRVIAQRENLRLATGLEIANQAG